jgi:hypothetical protein
MRFSKSRLLRRAMSQSPASSFRGVSFFPTTPTKLEGSLASSIFVQSFHFAGTVWRESADQAMYFKNLLTVMVVDRPALNATEKAFLSPFRAACKPIPHVALSQRIVTALVPVFSNNLDAAAFKAMRPSVVTETVGSVILTAVLSNVW